MKEGQKEYVKYTTNCTDRRTEKIGCFLFIPSEANRDGFFTSVSDVYPSLVELFAFANTRGIEVSHAPYNFPIIRSVNNE